MKLLLRWAMNAGALLLIANYVPGMGVSGFYAALVVILVLGLVNALIRPIVIFLTLPVNILTLGLFTFVINALMFWFVSTVVKGFEIEGFVPAFIGALLLTLVSWVVGSFLKKN
jgi:putative membrane protein